MEDAYGDLSQKAYEVEIEIEQIDAVLASGAG